MLYSSPVVHTVKQFIHHQLQACVSENTAVGKPRHYGNRGLGEWQSLLALHKEYSHCLFLH
jgi:hypothetical protein